VSEKSFPVKRLSLFVVVIALILGVVLFFSSQLKNEPNYQGGKAVGRLAPDVTLVKMDGSKISLRDLAGKTVFVNFFNSWCIPCQEEEPALEEFAKNHKDDPDFVFIGIARDDSDKNIRSWVKSHDAPFIPTFDKNEAASIQFGTTGQPETYAINADGEVVASILARASVDSLEKMWQATQ
jgi:cytochrome c biogenesis protein CcmG/thiol:disulfide interchange protein DsbE